MQIYSCAAVSTPEGGPKDNTPPELISSNPKSGSLQFKGGEVILSFSEYIAVSYTHLTLPTIYSV